MQVPEDFTWDKAFKLGLTLTGAFVILLCTCLFGKRVPLMKYMTWIVAVLTVFSGFLTAWAWSKIK